MASRLPFDFSQAKGPKRGPDVGNDVTAEFASAPGGMTVSALLALIKGSLAESLPRRLTVIGEISNLKMHSSGHIYFSLKDAGACINAAMFRQSAARLKFQPSDGMEVIVEGRVDVYEVRGQLQLYAETMTPKGAARWNWPSASYTTSSRRRAFSTRQARSPCRDFRGRSA